MLECTGSYFILIFKIIIERSGDMGKLTGKVALVTAAAKGIGFHSAKLLAENGAMVYITDIAEEAGKKAIETIELNNGKVKFIKHNAFEYESYKDFIEEILKDEGHIDILVNNFGFTDVTKDLDLLTGDTEEFFNIVNVNMRSVYLTSKYVIPSMIKNGGGSIINISSIGSISPDLSRMAYCVSKAAINSLTENIAAQYARFNVRCNAVLPGMTATDAVKDNMSNEFTHSFLSHVPLNKMAKPEDMAKAVLFFASDDSSYITGHLLDVAGGLGKVTPQYADYIREGKVIK